MPAHPPTPAVWVTATLPDSSRRGTVGGAHDADFPLVPAHHRRRPVDHGPGAQPAPRRSARRCVRRSVRRGLRLRPGGRTPRTSGAPPPRSGRRTSSTWPQVARSAEQLGFEAVLTPTGTWSEDAWLVTAALTRETSHLKFLVAFRPGLTSPNPGRPDGRHLPAAVRRPVAAQRSDLGLGRGSSGGSGDYLSHDDRYARTAEFLAIVRGAWAGELFDFHGEHYQVEGATGAAAAGPGAGGLLRWLLPGGGHRGGLVRGRLPDLGRAPGAGGGEAPPGSGAWPRPQGRTLRFGISGPHVITRD